MINSKRFGLFVASFLLLYFELAMIRWIPGHVRVIAYFTNFVLIACFFGMGLGLVLAKSKFDSVRWLGPAVLGLVLLTAGFKSLHVLSQGDVFLFLEYEGKGTGVPFIVVLAIFYAALALAFVPFGQAVGRAFGTEDPLKDYAANLLGSMAGTAVFFLYSWLVFPAWVWFLLGLPLVLLVVPRSRNLVLTTLACVAISVGLVAYLDRGTIWSPYQKLETAVPRGIDSRGNLFPYILDGKDVQPVPPGIGLLLRVNDDFYQHPLNLSDDFVKQVPRLANWRRQYDIPFTLRKSPGRVLIVGGGTGNDAAAAVRAGAQHVDVVEIDPRIVEIGRASHPERPYSDPRVTVHVDDARHFLKQASKGYDVVVFALLDSHRLLGTLSSLRLDSYVFTVECFREVRALLSDTGIQVTSFAIGEPWMTSRFYETLRAAYGEEPILVQEQGVATAGLVAVSGPGSRATNLVLKPRPVDTTAALLTDDWPFTYARGRFIPREYISALCLVIILSYLGLRVLGGQQAVPEWHFFFLGAGFLLLETRNVTTLALTFGSTWYVNSVVFFFIMAMALASALLVSRMQRDWRMLAYAGLGLAIAANYVVPLETFTTLGLGIRLLVVGSLTALPLFFSGIVFSQSFKRSADPARSLGANVLGGIFGGVVEYTSMVSGLRFLLVLAVVVYLASFLALRLGDRQGRAA